MNHLGDDELVLHYYGEDGPRIVAAESHLRSCAQCAGAYEALGEASAISDSVGWVNTLVATVVSFVVAYASIAWLLRYVAKHSIVIFVWYRVALGILLIIALATGVLEAT